MYASKMQYIFAYNRNKMMYALISVFAYINENACILISFFGWIR